MRPLTYILGGIAGFFTFGGIGLITRGYQLEDREDYIYPRIQVEKFKKMILDMYKGFPNTVYSEGDVKQVIVGGDARKKLVEKGFLMEEIYIDEKGKHLNYMLGPNALILVSSWKNEELAKWIKNLTIFLIGLTALLVILTILTIIHF